jgi:hypothetical protein
MLASTQAPRLPDILAPCRSIEYDPHPPSFQNPALIFSFTPAGYQTSKIILSQPTKCFIPGPASQSTVLPYVSGPIPMHASQLHGDLYTL